MRTPTRCLTVISVVFALAHASPAAASLADPSTPRESLAAAKTGAKQPVVKGESSFDRLVRAGVPDASAR